MSYARNAIANRRVAVNGDDGDDGNNRDAEWGDIWTNNQSNGSGTAVAGPANANEPDEQMVYNTMKAAKQLFKNKEGAKLEQEKKKNLEEIRALTTTTETKKAREDFILRMTPDSPEAMLILASRTSSKEGVEAQAAAAQAAAEKADRDSKWAMGKREAARAEEIQAAAQFEQAETARVAAEAEAARAKAEAETARVEAAQAAVEAWREKAQNAQAVQLAQQLPGQGADMQPLPRPLPPPPHGLGANMLPPPGQGADMQPLPRPLPPPPHGLGANMGPPPPRLPENVVPANAGDYIAGILDAFDEDNPRQRDDINPALVPAAAARAAALLAALPPGPVLPNPPVRPSYYAQALLNRANNQERANPSSDDNGNGVRMYVGPYARARQY